MLIPIVVGTVLLQPEMFPACPGETRDKDSKQMVYLSTAPLRSFGQRRAAGRLCKTI